MPSPQPFRIPAQRVPLLVPDQDIMSRQWYRFFNRKPRHGAFFDTTTQTAASPDTAYAVTFNNTASTFGINRGTPTSRIFVPDTSTYNFEFSAQVDKTSGSNSLIYFWPRINGIDVPNSASRVRIKDNNDEQVPAWNFMLDMQGGSYFELMWAVSNVNTRIQAEAATAFCPAIPSAILTAFEVSL